MEIGPGKHWWRNCCSHNQQLTLHTFDNLEGSRANALTKDVVDNYFTCLKYNLNQNGIVNGGPRQLFNYDETFLPLNTSCKKVIFSKNTMHLFSQPRGTSEHITILCGTSAAGVALLHMIVVSWRCGSIVSCLWIGRKILFPHYGSF